VCHIIGQIITRSHVYIVTTKRSRTEPCGIPDNNDRIIKYYEQILSRSIVPKITETSPVIYLINQICLLI